MTPTAGDDDIAAVSQTAGPVPPFRRARRRRLWAWGLAASLVLLVLIAGGGGALWVRLAAGPLVLPQALQARVEAQLDGAMALNDLSIGEIAVSLPDAVSPEIVLRGIALRDPDGGLRAGIPDLRVAVSRSALLRGQLRPTHVTIDGAGLRLRRDAEGVFDLELTGEDGSADGVNLSESLARLDAMFSSPALSRLEAVTGANLNVALADQVSGQVIRVRDADLRLEHKGDALTLTLTGGIEGSRTARVSIAISRQATLGRTDAGLTFDNIAARDLATVTSALGWLDLLRAPISGQLAANIRDDGTLGDLTAVLGIGAGEVTIGGAATPVAIERLDAVLGYDADMRVLRIDRIALQAPQLRTVISGRASVSDAGDVFVGQLALDGIEADPDGMFQAPLELDGAMLDLRVTLGPDLRVEVGEAVIFDDTLRLHARGTLVAGAEGITASLDASVDTIAAPRVLDYWPLASIPNTRRWVAENVQSGTLHGVDFALRLRPGARPISELQFDFAQARVRVVRALPPVEDAIGYLSLIGPRLIVRVDDGVMRAPDGGAVALGGSVFQIGDTGPRFPDATVDLAIDGALPDLMRLLAGPPVSLFARGPLGPEDIGTGRAELSAHLDFRLVRELGPGDLAFAVSGAVLDYRADALVAGRVLRAPRLQVAASNNAVAVSGRAMLDGVALTGQWGRAMGPEAPPGSQLEARAMLDAEALAGFGVVLPPGMVSGRTEADITVALAPDTPPLMRLSSDLDGLGLSLPQLGWRLRPGDTGDLTVDMRLGPSPGVTALSFAGAGLELRGRVDLAPGGGFRRLAAQRFRVGGWMDVTGALVGRGVGQPPGIEVTGGTVDLRRLQGGGSGAGSGRPGGPIQVALDRLQITEGIALTSLTADLSPRDGLVGDFVGRINGDANAPVSGVVHLAPAGPRVRLEAPDGGAVLRAAGLLRNIFGGTLQLTLISTGTRGHFDGQLRMTGARMRDAPAIAELLNVISVVGLLEQLGGDGINMGEVDADFRLTPEAIVLRQGTAVGPAMGLSMDGIYRTQARQFDMQGVVSPFYLLNGAIGTLFATRREGLFGVSYRLTGTPEDTDVSVNPLSILTPGIFREIFRSPSPDLSEVQE